MRIIGSDEVDARVSAWAAVATQEGLRWNETDVANRLAQEDGRLTDDYAIIRSVYQSAISRLKILDRPTLGELLGDKCPKEYAHAQIGSHYAVGGKGRKTIRAFTRSPNLTSDERAVIYDRLGRKIQKLIKQQTFIHVWDVNSEEKS